MVHVHVFASNIINVIKVEMLHFCETWYVSLERASQEEQNGTKFSSVAPPSEELRVCKEIRSKRLTIVHGFRP